MPSTDVVTCRVCGSQSPHEYLLAKDLNQANSDALFHYYSCRDCRSLLLYPIPDNLDFYYGQTYPAYAVAQTKNARTAFDYLEPAKLALVRQYATSGTLVEVGPAAGLFLSAASKAGFDVHGIEQDPGCVRHIRDSLGLSCCCSRTPAEELARLTDSCDVIVAWHVIEHLQDLKGFVSAVSAAVRQPGGVIIVSSPNPEALSFRLFGRYWVHLDAPRHLTLIPLSALDRLMAAHGLQRVSCVFDDAVGRLLTRVGWQRSVAHLTRQHKMQPRMPIRLMGRLLAISMSLVERICGTGAAYTAVYKHRDSQ